MLLLLLLLLNTVFISIFYSVNLIQDRKFSLNKNKNRESEKSEWKRERKSKEKRNDSICVCFVVGGVVVIVIHTAFYFSKYTSFCRIAKEWSRNWDERTMRHGISCIYCWTCTCSLRTNYTTTTVKYDINVKRKLLRAGQRCRRRNNIITAALL